MKTLKHIVMMKLKPMEKEAFQENLETLKSMLNDLKAFIPSLQTMEVGLNISSRPTAYDIVLVSEFGDEQALNDYRIHPKHVEVLAFIKEIVQESKVVDYWVE